MALLPSDGALQPAEVAHCLEIPLQSWVWGFCHRNERFQGGGDNGGPHFCLQRGISPFSIGRSQTLLKQHKTHTQTSQRESWRAEEEFPLSRKFQLESPRAQPGSLHSAPFLHRTHPVEKVLITGTQASERRAAPMKAVNCLLCFPLPGPW